jgi:hypothetical protein
MSDFASSKNICDAQPKFSVYPAPDTCPVSPEETHAATRKVCDALIDAPALSEKSLKVTLALALAEARTIKM